MSMTSIQLRWTASRTDDHAAEYRVYVDGSLRASVRPTAYRVTRLQCGMHYVLSVRAYDAAGHGSPVLSGAAKTFRCATGRKPAPSGPPCTPKSRAGDDLSTVIAAASPAAVVCVSGDYGSVRIGDVHKAAVVVQPAAGSSASMDLDLDNSSGLRLRGLIISGLVVQDSSNHITFSHNTFTGMSVILTGISHADDRVRLESPRRHQRRLPTTTRAGSRSGVTRPPRLWASRSETTTSPAAAPTASWWSATPTGVVIGPGNDFDHLYSGQLRSACRPDPALRRSRHRRNRQLFPRQRRRHRRPRVVLG